VGYLRAVQAPLHRPGQQDSVIRPTLSNFQISKGSRQVQYLTVPPVLNSSLPPKAQSYPPSHPHTALPPSSTFKPLFFQLFFGVPLVPPKSCDFPAHPLAHSVHGCKGKQKFETRAKRKCTGMKKIQKEKKINKAVVRKRRANYFGRTTKQQGTWTSTLTPPTYMYQ